MDLAGETIADNLLITPHHVGAENPLIVFHSDVDPGQPHVSLQHPAASFLRRHKPQAEKVTYNRLHRLSGHYLSKLNDEKCIIIIVIVVF